MAAVTVAVAGTGDTSNAATYTSGAFTPATGDLVVILAVVSGSLLSGGASGTATGSANSLTFTRAATCLTQGGGGQVYLFIANQLVGASPASMTVTVDVTGNPGTGATISVARVSGMTLTGSSALRQEAHLEQQTSGTALSVSFPAAALTANVVLAQMCNATNPATVTPPTSFTEGGDTGYATPTAGYEWAYRASGHTVAAVTWGSNSASAWSGMVAELDTTAPPSNPTVRSSTNVGSTTNTNNLSVTMPAGLTAGDLLLLEYGSRSTNAPTDPVNWIRVGTHASGSGRSAGLYKKVATGSETTLTFDKGSTSAGFAVCKAITANSYDATNPIESYTTDMAEGTLANPPLPVAANTIANGLANSFGGQRIAATTGTGMTQPAGWTSDANAFCDDDTNGMGYGSCHKTIATVTNTPSDTWTPANSNSGPLVTYIVRPASGTGGGGGGGTGAVAKVRNSGAWQTATAKVWSAGAWHVATPRVYSGGQWVPATGSGGGGGSTSRFQGDPGLGRIMLGVAKDNTAYSTEAAGYAANEATLSAQSPALTRNLSYYRAFHDNGLSNQVRFDSSEFSWAIGQNMMIFCSHKGTASSILSGALDADLAFNASLFNTWKASNVPFFWTYYHEPEDNFTTSTQAEQFRAAWRYCADYYIAAGCDNVVRAAPCYQGSGTFNPGGFNNRDWRFWQPDWKGTTTNSGGHTGDKNDPNPVDFYAKDTANARVQAMSFDMYDQAWKYGTAISNYNLTWHEEMLTRWEVTRVSGNYPWIIGEIGARTKQSGSFTSGTTGWVGTTFYDTDSAANFNALGAALIRHNVVAASWWNNTKSPSSGQDDRLNFSDPSQIRWKALAGIIDSSAYRYPPVAYTP